jgi:hypothetical protein
MVIKKTGDWRCCNDYRELNKITIKDRYPLPRIDDLLKSVKGASHFVGLDLRAGYWQIPMAQADIPKTALRTHHGLWEYMVMPFGLTNAPATFQRTMDTLFGDLYYH